MNNSLKILILLILSLAVVSCGSARKAAKTDRDAPKEEVMAEDSTIFVPLHPPVVVPHKWNESGSPDK